MSAIGDPWPRRRDTGNGFTLIEMLVVLAIAGLVGGLMFPAVDRALETVRFQSAQSSVTNGLTEARARAIRTGLPVTLRFSQDQRTFVIADDRPVGTDGAVHLSSAPRDIVFFADGTATGGVISVRGTQRTARLRVSEATGLIVALHDAS